MKEFDLTKDQVKNFISEARRQQEELWGPIFPPEWVEAEVEKQPWKPIQRG